MPALPRGEPRSRCEFFCLTHNSNLALPLGEMSRSDREGLAPSLRELDLPQAKTEGAASYLSRIRLSFAQTCPRAAPSVTACAAPPSSGRKALVFRTNQLVSPSGRDVAQRQRGLAPSSRELDCRLAARLREQPIICHASGKLLRRPARVLLLPSRLAPRHLPQGGRLLVRAVQTCLSLWERCRAATERAGSLLEGAGFAAGKD